MSALMIYRKEVEEDASLPGGLALMINHSFIWKINFAETKGMSQAKYKKFLNSRKFSVEIPTKLGFSVLWSLRMETQRGWGVRFVPLRTEIAEESILMFPTTANFYFDCEYEIPGAIPNSIFQRGKSFLLNKIREGMPCVEVYGINIIRNSKYNGPIQYSSRNSPFQEDDTLVIQGQVKIYAEKTFIEIQRAENKFRLNLIANFASLLENPKETRADVTIVSKDGVEFKAHKPILLARNEALKKMLTCGLKESQIGVIELKELSSKAVRFLLHYIYAGDLLPYVVNVEDAEKPCISELVYAADMYMMQDLLAHFDENIGNLCDAGNVAFLLRLAKKFSLTKAQADIKTCAKKNEAVFDKFLESFGVN